jgi:hypothetical protein
VRNRISELRRWLGGTDTVIAQGDNLRLGHVVKVDWWELNQRSTRPDTLSGALTLVRGRPLVGVLDGWAEHDYWQDAIEAKIVAVAAAAAEKSLRQRQWQQALQDAETGLHMCPYDQRLTRAAMRAAAGDGDIELVHAIVARAEAELDEGEALDSETLDLLHSLTRDQS